MSRMKKIFVLVLTMIMTLSMTAMVFAAEEDSPKKYESTITVHGLSEKESTTVSVYPLVTLVIENGGYSWKIADGASDFVGLSDDKKSYIITNETKLANYFPESPQYSLTTAQSPAESGLYSTVAEFGEVPVGAYVIRANGNSSQSSYNVMVANTYDTTKTYLTAKDEDVNAKVASYGLDKQAKEGDQYVGKGESIEFTISTIFPAANIGDTYKIVDSPIGLTVDAVKLVKIEDKEYTNVEVAYDEKYEGYVIDLTKFIDATNSNAGKTVTVTYTATVMTENGYSNTANAYKNAEELGEGETQGYSADLKVTKVSTENTNRTLKGAEFEVYSGTKENPGTKLSFVKKEDGIYILATKGDIEAEKASTTIQVNDNGSVQVKGLGDGKYWFKEIKAPEGYSINEDGVQFEVLQSPDSANLHKSALLADTKLPALPSTGGMGTMLFILGGVLLMVLAFALLVGIHSRKTK